MKVSKEQLKKIIQEELSAAIQEGELEEGFMDWLRGTNEIPSDNDIKSKLDNVKSSLKGLYNTAGKAGDYILSNFAKKMLGDIEVQGIEKKIGQHQGPQRAGEKEDVSSLKNLRDSLKSDLASGKNSVGAKRTLEQFKKLAPEQQKVNLPSVEELSDYNKRPMLNDLKKRLIKVLDNMIPDKEKFTGNLPVRSPVGSGKPLEKAKLEE